jgi:hypothetical protein
VSETQLQTKILAPWPTKIINTQKLVNTCMQITFLVNKYETENSLVQNLASWLKWRQFQVQNVPFTM